MDLFKEFGTKINHGINQVTSKTRDYTDQVKIESEIRNMEKNMDECYIKLGRIYYEAKREINTADSETEEKILTQIDTIRRRLEEKSQNKEELKNKIICPSCGKTVAENTKFCPYCGIEIIKKLQGTTVPEENRPVCPNCGTPLEEGALFCVSCGAHVERTEQTVKDIDAEKSEN